MEYNNKAASKHIHSMLCQGIPQKKSPAKRGRLWDYILRISGLVVTIKPFIYQLYLP
jgi:hypothetical protein